MITVVYFMDDALDGEMVVDYTKTVVGTLVDGVLTPFTFDSAVEFADATGGAVYVS